MSGESKREAARRRIAEKRAAEAAERAKAQRRQRTVIGGVVAAVVLVVAVVAVVLVQTHRTSTSASAAVPANTTDGGYAFQVGNTGAKVTLDMYEDFQCPNCKNLEDNSGDTIDQLVAAGTVKVRYHGMAFLNTSKNDQYSTRSLNAAAVVASTAGADAYEKFHQLLFANQPPETGGGLSDAQLTSYAHQAGATDAKVATEIKDLTFGEWVKASTDQASKDGVTSTPTVLVNGKRLTDLSPAGLTAAVNTAKG